MPTFSHSRMSVFENCRLKYKYSYIDRIKVERETTVEAFLGSCVHETLEKLYRDIRYEKELSLEELIEIYNHIWDSIWNDSILINKEEYSANHYKKMGERYTTEYYERNKPFREGKIIGLETQDYLSLDDKGKYKYHVRIDRLMDMGDGMYEVHDYKTNMRLPSQEDLDNDRQLAMYSLWVRERFPDFKKVTLVWHFLAFDKKLSSTRTSTELDDLCVDVLGIIDRIEKEGSFFPSTSALCSWCLYQEICPEWKHEKTIEKLEPEEFLKEDGVKLVDDYVKIKNALDEQKKNAGEKLELLKEKLIAYSRSQGVSVIAGSEKKISLKEYDTLKFPGKNSDERSELETVIKEIGKWDDVSNLDIYALSRVVQNKNWENRDLESIEDYWESEKGLRISLQKKKSS